MVIPILLTMMTTPFLWRWRRHRHHVIIHTFDLEEGIKKND